MSNARDAYMKFPTVDLSHIKHKKLAVEILDAAYKRIQYHKDTFVCIAVRDAGFTVRKGFWNKVADAITGAKAKTAEAIRQEIVAVIKPVATVDRTKEYLAWENGRKFGPAEARQYRLAWIEHMKRQLIAEDRSTQ